MMQRALVLVLVGACYSPTYPSNLYCGENGECPPNQECGPNNLCRAISLVDARRFVDVVDMPVGDAPGACDLVSQTGCGFNTKCTTNADLPPMHVCAPNGAVGVGGNCTGTVGAQDNCLQGLICIWGTCHTFCDAANPPSTCASNTCAPFFGFDACITACDPLAPACPASNGMAQNCYINVNGAGCSVSSMNLAIGVACSHLNDCVGGAGCVSDVCRKYCDFGAAPNMQGTCSTGQTCQQVQNNWGACI